MQAAFVGHPVSVGDKQASLRASCTRAMNHRRHCERSEAIQEHGCESLDCFVTVFLAMTH